VKDNYLFTPAEIQQNLRTLNLFEKFDADGSGALDADELTILYQD
jgi:Ca2+-binding EF-hand superfamily protein